ncbi:hypothetical protein GCK32_020788, partial [Trichostrongylus colubriformis]
MGWMVPMDGLLEDVLLFQECDTPQRTSRETICGGEEILSKQQCEVVCKSRSSGSHFLWRMADGAPCQAESNRAVCSHGTCQVCVLSRKGSSLLRQFIAPVSEGRNCSPK